MQKLTFENRNHVQPVISNYFTEPQMIHLIKELATSIELKEMLQEYDSMIKIVVDIRRLLLAGGGTMHADCESLLLEDGSGPLTNPIEVTTDGRGQYLLPA